MPDFGGGEGLGKSPLFSQPKGAVEIMGGLPPVPQQLLAPLSASLAGPPHLVERPGRGKAAWPLGLPGGAEGVVFMEPFQFLERGLLW